MKYILMIYGDENEWANVTPEEMARIYAEHGAYAEAMTEAGVLRGGEELKPTSTATTLRFSGGRPTTVDGPFAESKEQLGGFYMIEVESLDEALEWAAKMPGMTFGSVEVRPINEMEMPPSA